MLLCYCCWYDYMYITTDTRFGLQSADLSCYRTRKTRDSIARHEQITGLWGFNLTTLFIYSTEILFVIMLDYLCTWLPDPFCFALLLQTKHGNATIWTFYRYKLQRPWLDLHESLFLLPFRFLFRLDFLGYKYPLLCNPDFTWTRSWSDISFSVLF